MSIASELLRIKNAKEAIRAAINDKGGNLTENQSLADYAVAVTNLSVTATSIAFYKCAAIDTVTKTWTGYKTILTDGVYTFEESITSGLTYTVITPVIDRVYTADALCEIKKLFDGSLIPTEGQVFYAPLAEAKTTAETGQALTTSGNVTYSTVDDIPCVMLDGQSYLYGADNLISGAKPFSYSLWVKPQSTSAVQWFGSVGNTNSQGTCFLTGIRFAGKYSGGFYYYDNSESPVNADTTKWTHLLFTYDGATLKTYANGAWQHDFNVGAMNLQDGWTIGCIAGSRYDEKMSGAVAAVRVYDRMLTDDEITELSKEFTTENTESEEEKIAALTEQKNIADAALANAVNDETVIANKLTDITELNEQLIEIIG